MDISLSYVRRPKWDAGPRVIGEAFLAARCSGTLQDDVSDQSQDDERDQSHKDRSLKLGDGQGHDCRTKRRAEIDKTRAPLHPNSEGSPCRNGRPHAGRVR